MLHQISNHKPVRLYSQVLSVFGGFTDLKDNQFVEVMFKQYICNLFIFFKKNKFQRASLQEQISKHHYKSKYLSINWFFLAYAIKTCANKIV